MSSERIWTPAQIEAFSSQAPDILVSAAAGSGKTAVLTKRIIDKLTDPEQPAEITRLLIVTFTKAAATELKERIRGALTAAMAENPKNKHLQRQYLRLSDAKITTIHGFCLDLIRSHFQELELSPDIKVSDESQTKLLMQQVANRVIDNYYASLPGYDNIENFIAFADNFIALQDDRLVEIMISIYNKVSSFPDGISFLKATAEDMKSNAEKDITQTVFGRLVLSHYQQVFSYFSSALDDACGFFEEDEEFSSKYLPSFAHDRDTARALLNAVTSGSFSRTADLLNEYFPIKLKTVKSELQCKDSISYRELRSKFSDTLKKARSDFFSVSSSELVHTARATADFVQNLFLFLSAFESKYHYEKRVRSLLDFSDLERLALRLLVSSDGSATSLAQQISADYDEIYIDEYQDVNKVQDMMFSSIAAHADRFMVGDIKQSIYGFRGAEPSLFADYRKDNSIYKIFLSHNFRSDLPIINFVNRVCGTLFTAYGTTVPYDQSDDLVCGKGASQNVPVEINVIRTNEKKISLSRAEEARYVAKRISTLLAEGYHPKDICILLRSASKSAPYYEEALTKLNIPCRNRVATHLFTNPEVLLVINLLNIVDNPLRDVYFAGALKSPIFNFTLDELIMIRNYQKSGSLFEAFKKYTVDTAFEKGLYVLQKLDAYRSMINEPVSKLIWQIFCDEQLFAVVSADCDESVASERKSNLMLLYDMARRFERGSFKGLYHFNRYLNDLLESGVDLPSSSNQVNDDVVKIMTIHQSKGLEFPVVFLCDTASPFNSSDRNDRVIIDKDYGVTLKLSDPSGLATVDTFYRRAAGLGIIAKSMDEEIRILYVALTRAVHCLIITGIDSDPQGRVDLCRKSFGWLNGANKDILRQHNNYLDWILLTAEEYRLNIVDTLDSLEEIFPTNESAKTLPDIDTSIHHDEIAPLVAELSQRFSYRYPNEAASLLPAKLSVSELYPEILDDYSDSLKLTDIRKSNMRRPRFLSDSSSSPADIGTATHLFMQFCDFERLQRLGADKELERLTVSGYLDAHTASLVDLSMIQGLMLAPIFTELSMAEDLRRELRFNVRLPAAFFTEQSDLKASLDNESILVQGIMDCVFTDKAGRLTLLDYKTDRLPSSTSYQEAEKILIDRHRRQIMYYCLACEKMMCKRIERIVLYAFSLGYAIEVDPNDLL